MMRRGNESHHRARPVDGGAILVLCGVVLIVFFVVMFAARFVPIGTIATGLLWSGVASALLVGIAENVRAKRLSMVFVVIMLVCMVTWPLSLIVWLQSL